MSEWRFERKIALGPGDLLQLENLVTSHPAGLVVAYPTRIVRNVYFDTPDLVCFQSHVAGIEFRTKWRLRAYDNSAWLQLEEKRKLGDHGDKLHHPLESAVQSLRSNSAVLLRDYLMYPVIENRYQRRYYHAPAWGIRLTIDTSIQYARVGSGLWQFDPEFVAVAEIKYDLAQAKAGQKFLEALPWRVSRFSKYVRGLRFLEIT